MPCKHGRHDCQNCERPDKPLPPEVRVLPDGTKVESTRPACHSRVHYGGYVPIQEGTERQNNPQL